MTVSANVFQVTWRIYSTERSHQHWWSPFDDHWIYFFLISFLTVVFFQNIFVRGKISIPQTPRAFSLAKQQSLVLNMDRAGQAAPGSAGDEEFGEEVDGEFHRAVSVVAGSTALYQSHWIAITFFFTAAPSHPCFWLLDSVIQPLACWGPPALPSTRKQYIWCHGTMTVHKWWLFSDSYLAVCGEMLYKSQGKTNMSIAVFMELFQKTSGKES